MSSGSSQDHDGGRARIRRPISALGSERATTMRPVKSVGRHADRLWCPTCGLKRKDCRCEARA
jgi:hypothetical protein